MYRSIEIGIIHFFIEYFNRFYGIYAVSVPVGGRHCENNLGECLLYYSLMYL